MKPKEITIEWLIDKIEYSQFHLCNIIGDEEATEYIKQEALNAVGYLCEIINEIKE